jgi:hypothetical protein
MRSASQPTDDDRINAIILRDTGIPYPDVLETTRLSSTVFHKAVTFHLRRYVALPEGSTKRTLRDISEDPQFASVG